MFSAFLALSLEFQELIKQLDLLSSKSKSFITQMKDYSSSSDSSSVSASLKPSSLSSGYVLWLEPLSSLQRQLDGLELSVRLEPLFWHVKSLEGLLALWMYIFLKVIKIGFLYSSKISAIRNSRFKAVTDALITFIVLRELRCLSTYEGNTASKDLRYWLTLSTKSILNPENVKRATILLNIALKSVKEPL